MSNSPSADSSRSRSQRRVDSPPPSANASPWHSGSIGGHPQSPESQSPSSESLSPRRPPSGASGLAVVSRDQVRTVASPHRRVAPHVNAAVPRPSLSPYSPADLELFRTPIRGVLAAPPDTVYVGMLWPELRYKFSFPWRREPTPDRILTMTHASGQSYTGVMMPMEFGYSRDCCVISTHASNLQRPPACPAFCLPGILQLPRIHLDLAALAALHLRVARSLAIVENRAMERRASEEDSDDSLDTNGELATLTGASGRSQTGGGEPGYATAEPPYVYELGRMESGTGGA
jgi:hypothetical protein